jgi:hypothetical protein
MLFIPNKDRFSGGYLVLYVSTVLVVVVVILIFFFEQFHNIKILPMSSSLKD